MAPQTRIRTKRLALQKERFSLTIDEDYLRMGTIQQYSWGGVATSHSWKSQRAWKPDGLPFEWEVRFNGC